MSYRIYEKMATVNDLMDCCEELQVAPDYELTQQGQQLMTSGVVTDLYVNLNHGEIPFVRGVADAEAGIRLRHEDRELTLRCLNGDAKDVVKRYYPGALYLGCTVRKGEDSNSRIYIFNDSPVIGGWMLWEGDNVEGQVGRLDDYIPAAIDFLRRG